MELNRIWAVYFSGTGTTRTAVCRVAEAMARLLQLPCEKLDFTLPAARQETYGFSAGDLVVLGTPVYAGRVPNVLLPFFKEHLSGSGALAVPVVLYGNRNYDDALRELCDLLTAARFCPVAAAAFVGEHAFSRTLGAGRPDKEDLAAMDDFAAQAAEKICSLTEAQPVAVRGEDPIRPYYQPRDRQGNPINILKVKPKTDAAKCDGCGLCAARCPMGSIPAEDVMAVRGICIKCCACVKGCPTGAKYFDDAGYLYHQHELEAMYARRAPVETFL